MLFECVCALCVLEAVLLRKEFPDCRAVLSVYVQDGDEMQCAAHGQRWHVMHRKESSSGGAQMQV